MLIVYSAGQTFRFRLTETASLLPALLKCVQGYNASSETAANPFGGDPPKAEAAAPAPAPPPDPNVVLIRRAEATSFVANVLGRSGLTGFQIEPLDTAPHDGIDAAWRAGDTYGFVNIVDDAAVKSDDLNAALLASDAKSCKDKFLSGSMPDKDGPRLFTSCKSDSSTVTVFYSLVKRPKGGFYVLSTAGIEKTALGDGKPTREADNGIRSAAFKVVSTP